MKPFSHIFAPQGMILAFLCCSFHGRTVSRTAPSFFEAVSIREVKMPSAGPRVRALLDYDPTRLHIVNSLDILIDFAFGLQQQQLVPAAHSSDLFQRWFEITAVTQAPASRQKMLAMLQPELIARFHIKYHAVYKETEIFALRIAPAGLKVSPLSILDPAPIRQPWEFTADNFHDLAKFLDALGSHGLGGINRHVMDQTGNADRYAIRLSIGRDGTFNIPPSLDLRALVRTLGLELVPAHGRYEHLVIDSIRTPSSN